MHKQIHVIVNFFYIVFGDCCTSINVLTLLVLTATTFLTRCISEELALILNYLLACRQSGTNIITVTKTNNFISHFVRCSNLLAHSTTIYFDKLRNVCVSWEEASVVAL